MTPMRLCMTGVSLALPLHILGGVDEGVALLLEAQLSSLPQVHQVAVRNVKAFSRFLAA
jgi:hypothetical protein